ncbi:jhdm-1 [Pristionchus pacificus]|uniref:JmjC domain-containing protein n=1 Tax=Pristionchus pacificus TaxID=54126 RepID=A0A8R1YAN5_PRIPA|nr:jhdm-1 [Pristionchus pacificus]
MLSNTHQKPKDVSYDYQELLNDPAYNKPELYKSMEPEEFNMDYYHRTGLTEVLKFSCPPEKLGMKMVDDDFTVDDVEKLVGGDRMITVVVVATQQSEDMPLKKFIEFYKNVDGRQSNSSKDDSKRTLYNVLSLEFSNTALTDLVQSPSLVREIDWASSWPDERKMRSISFEDDGTFTIQNRYPRVENYCLMSPNECYTDFHIDFHGTSVWYHVKKGKKVFWIIEPTEQNLKMYEEYLKNTESSAFFGTIVETCARVEVLPGNTLIIPSGWIHAVYTPVDSLVFGGNFLHSRSALMQLNVLQGENRIGINKKYRYPYSEEAVFFYLNKVVKEVTGRQYIRPMTRNQQNLYYEYVGEQFREKNMHHRVPLKADYDDEGIVWKQQWEETAEYIESKAKLAKWDGNGMEEIEKDEENHDKKVDGDYDGMPILSPKKEVNEDKKKIDAKVEEKDMPEFGGHDDMFIDEFTFYHPVSFNLDAGRGATAVHTLPLSTVEPRIKISKVTLKKAIHQLEVVQWEGLIVNLLKKSKVDVPDGLTRPNSLIQTFCTLLRCRRQLVEEEEGIKLGRCVLPDKEGSRRLHEEQKRAAAERKRKNEEKKMKIEDGDGEEDTDWTEDCEQPKKKKTRKSEEVGKMGWFSREMEPKKEKEDEKERKKNSSTNAWNQAFYQWYADDQQKEFREEYRAKYGKDARTVIRKEVYTKLDKEEKMIWLEKAKAKIEAMKKENDGISSPMKSPPDSTPITPSPSTSSTPISRPKRSKSNKIIPFDPSPSTSKSTFSMEDLSMEMDDEMNENPSFLSSISSISPPSTTSLPKKTIAKRGRQKKNQLNSQLDPSLISPINYGDSCCNDELKPIAHVPEVKLPSSMLRGQTARQISFEASTSKQSEGIRRQECNQKNEQNQMRNMMQPTGMRVIHANNDALRQAMQQKLESDGRLAYQRLPPADANVVTDRISLYIVNYLSSKNILSQILNYIYATNSQIKGIVMEKLTIVQKNVSQFVKKDVPFDIIKNHLILLKNCVLSGAHNKGEQIPFIESMKIVARALDVPLIPSLPTVNSASSPCVISLKPVDASLKAEQTSKTPCLVQKKIETIGVIGLKPLMNTTSTVEKEKDEKGDNENGGTKIIGTQSDFHLATLEAKPPEEEDRGESFPSEESFSSSHSIPNSPNLRMNDIVLGTSIKKDEKCVKNGGQKEEFNANGEGMDKIKGNANLELPTEERKDMNMITVPPVTLVKISPVKDMKKEDDIDDGFGSNEECSSNCGSHKKSMRENHWMVMKKAQEKVPVKKYTDSPQDWTPFDAYLRINYHRWCKLYNEEPNNELVLTIKRRHWNCIANQDGEIRKWEEDANRFRAEGRRRIYWKSETVIEQDDRIVEDRGLKVIPLGGEEKTRGRGGLESEGEIKNEDEYLADDDETVDEKEDEMIDVEGMEDEIPINTVEMIENEEMIGEEGVGEIEEPPKKKGKGGRPKKEPVSEKKKKEKRGDNEDFMTTGLTPRGKGKKAKPDPNKPLIIDGVPVNPLAEPAVANAYGYDPAKDIVPLGQGQLKSAYRRSKAQLDTPQIDAKRYKLEVKHDHLLDDDDHDDTHRDEIDVVDGGITHSMITRGGDMMEGINVHTGGDGPSHPITPTFASNDHSSPFNIQSRSSSFSRRPIQTMQQTPPLIPHAPSPLAARRISGVSTDGWGGMNGGRRRSDGERRDRQSSGRSPTRKPSSQFSSSDLPPSLTPSHTPHTPVAPTTSSTPIHSTTLSTSKQTRLSQAEQFTMAAPKVIDAPRLATPLIPTQSSNSDLSVLSQSNSISGIDPLPSDIWCAQMERFTAEIERANAIMGSTSANGN